jgi:hypothetical protein
MEPVHFVTDGRDHAKRAGPRRHPRPDRTGPVPPSPRIVLRRRRRSSSTLAGFPSPLLIGGSRLSAPPGAWSLRFANGSQQINRKFGVCGAALHCTVLVWWVIGRISWRIRLLLFFAVLDLEWWTGGDPRASVRSLLFCACGGCREASAFGWSQLRPKGGRRTMSRPPILSVALPSDTGRVLSIQSHTVQVQPMLARSSSYWVLACLLSSPLCMGQLCSASVNGSQSVIAVAL